MESYELRLVLIWGVVGLIICGLLSYHLGYYDGTRNMEKKFTLQQELREYCDNPYYYYSDNHLRQCEAIGIRPAE